MGARVEYLERGPTGRLSYRRIYPANLRPHIAGGRRELKVSLGAAAISAPGALDKFKAAADRYDANVALARKLASKTFDRLDADLIARLADTYRARELAADDNATWGELIDRGYARRPNGPEDDWRECRAMLEEDDREGLARYWSDWTPGYAAALGYVIDTTGTPFARLSYAMAEAACDVWLTIDARREKTDRLDSKTTRTPPEPAAPVAALKPPTPSSGSFEAIAETILDNPRYAVGVSTKQAARTALRFLSEAHGPLVPAAVTRLAITEFLNLLSQRPARLPTKERKLPLRDLATRYADRPDVPRLSAKTLAQHTGQLAALWRKGQSEGLIDDTLPDPFAKRALTQAPAPVARPQGVLSRTKYKPFDKDNRSRTLLAIGTGLLSKPYSFAEGIGAAGENVGKLRDQYEDDQRPDKAQVGGPDNAFQIITDRETGEVTYKPIAPVVGYLKTKQKAERAPKADDNVQMRGNTMAAILALHPDHQAQAYADFRDDSTRLGYDLGLPDEWNPDVAAAMAGQTISPTDRMKDERAAASRTNAQTNADRNYGLRVQADNRAERKFQSPPSTRKARRSQQALPAGAILEN